MKNEEILDDLEDEYYCDCPDCYNDGYEKGWWKGFERGFLVAGIILSIIALIAIFKCG